MTVSEWRRSGTGSAETAVLPAAPCGHRGEAVSVTHGWTLVPLAAHENNWAMEELPAGASKA